jgi:peptidoglycan/LPS O-acetylase OafA/YrhL
MRRGAVLAADGSILTTNVCNLRKEGNMSFAIYLIGFAVFIGGVAWALVTAGVPQLYVAIACVILLGIGILTGVSRTRSKDPPS